MSERKEIPQDVEEIIEEIVNPLVEAIHGKIFGILRNDAAPHRNTITSIAANFGKLADSVLRATYLKGEGLGQLLPIFPEDSAHAFAPEDDEGPSAARKFLDKIDISNKDIDELAALIAGDKKNPMREGALEVAVILEDPRLVDILVEMGSKPAAACLLQMYLLSNNPDFHATIIESIRKNLDGSTNPNSRIVSLCSDLAETDPSDPNLGPLGRFFKKWLTPT